MYASPGFGFLLDFGFVFGRLPMGSWRSTLLLLENLFVGIAGITVKVIFISRRQQQRARAVLIHELMKPTLIA